MYFLYSQNDWVSTLILGGGDNRKPGIGTQ